MVATGLSRRFLGKTLLPCGRSRRATSTHRGGASSGESRSGGGHQMPGTVSAEAPFATAKSRGAEMQRAISTYSGKPYRDEALQGWIRKPCGRRAIERALWRDSRGVALTEYLVVLGGCVLLAIPAINGLSSALRETSGVEGQRIASLTFSPGNATPAPGINQPTLALAANATPAPALTPPPPTRPPSAPAITPSPSPGPAPQAPPPSPPPQQPSLPPNSPPINFLHMGTIDGGVRFTDDAAARNYLEQKIAQRVANLARAGEDHNTSPYGPSDALATVAGMTTEIDSAARTYGVNRALLAGTIASEVDFDTGWEDVVQNGAASVGIYGGSGHSVANVHLDELEKAKKHLVDNKLPGASAAEAFAATNANVTAHPAEAAAIMLAWKADLKRRAGGSVTSPEDMSVVFASYRVLPGSIDLAKNEYAGGKELAAKTGDPNAKVGSNAYQSEAYFQYYQEYYKAVDAVRSSSSGGIEF